jgi:hypothetical protein
LRACGRLSSASLPTAGAASSCLRRRGSSTCRPSLGVGQHVGTAPGRARRGPGRGQKQRMSVEGNSAGLGGVRRRALTQSRPSTRRTLLRPTRTSCPTCVFQITTGTPATAPQAATRLRCTQRRHAAAPASRAARRRRASGRPDTGRGGALAGGAENRDGFRSTGRVRVCTPADTMIRAQRSQTTCERDGWCR